MSPRKRTVLFAVLTLLLSGAAAAQDLNDLSNPLNPLSPLNPLNPLNPVNVQRRRDQEEEEDRARRKRQEEYEQEQARVRQAQAEEDARQERLRAAEEARRQREIDAENAREERERRAEELRQERLRNCDLIPHDRKLTPGQVAWWRRQEAKCREARRREAEQARLAELRYQAERREQQRKEAIERKRRELAERKREREERLAAELKEKRTRAMQDRYAVAKSWLYVYAGFRQIDETVVEAIVHEDVRTGEITGYDYNDRPIHAYERVRAKPRERFFTTGDLDLATCSTVVYEALDRVLKPRHELVQRLLGVERMDTIRVLIDAVGEPEAGDQAAVAEWRKRPPTASKRAGVLKIVVKLNAQGQCATLPDAAILQTLERAR